MSRPESLFRLWPAATTMIEQRHVEGASAARYLPADAAQADDAKRAAVDLTAKQVRRIVVQKVGAAGVAIALDQSPSDCQQQGEGEVRRGAVENTGRVAYGNAAGRRCCHVDVIDAHAEIADDTDARQTVEQARVN